MNDESGSKILASRLWEEIVVRNSFSFIPHCIQVIVAGLFCYEMHLARPMSLLSYLFVVGGCSLRGILFRSVASKSGPTKLQRGLFYLAMVCLGLGWSLLLHFTYDFYGFYSINGLLSFLFLTGLISSAPLSNAAQPLAYISLIIPIILFPTVRLLNHPSAEDIMLACCIYCYAAFNLLQLRISYSYIKQVFIHELAITMERDKIQNLVNAVPGYVSFIDKHLNYLSVNDFGKAFFDLKDCIGQNICGDYPESEFSRFINKFMREEKHTATSEIKFDLKNRQSTFIVSIQKNFESLGGAVIVAIPMDELIETREKMKVQEAKAFYTAKLVSLGEMAAGIAHEINNPLSVILISSEQITRQMKMPGLQLERVEIFNQKIQKMVGRITLIIKSLRMLARDGERDPYMPFKLDAILEPSIEITRQRFIEEKVELEINRPQSEIVCIGQEIQLSQVMMNLLSNAFDAAIDGPAPRWVKLQVKPGEEHVDICIQDSGAGIPLDIRNKIMEPFFTTKSFNKGTGLGLSISKSIMDQHGGMLTLDELAVNTTFVMRMKKEKLKA